MSIVITVVSNFTRGHTYIHTHNSGVIVESIVHNIIRIYNICGQWALKMPRSAEEY